MNYESWGKEVDRLIGEKYGGLTSEDVPDYIWRELYDDGLDPQDAFESWMEDPNYGPEAYY